MASNAVSVFCSHHYCFLKQEEYKGPNCQETWLHNEKICFQVFLITYLLYSLQSGRNKQLCLCRLQPSAGLFILEPRGGATFCHPKLHLRGAAQHWIMGSCGVRGGHVFHLRVPKEQTKRRRKRGTCSGIIMSQ